LFFSKFCIIISIFFLAKSSLSVIGVLLTIAAIFYDGYANEFMLKQANKTANKYFFIVIKFFFIVIKITDHLLNIDQIVINET